LEFKFSNVQTFIEMRFWWKTFYRQLSYSADFTLRLPNTRHPNWW